LVAGVLDVAIFVISVLTLMNRPDVVSSMQPSKESPNSHESSP
jgi:hypothetical protein